ncbi:hypothetical protein HDV05_000531 [Chytridiales sp. JEL 0842]|nr:hypothetical protein HDV05_000531 [Chytridiales sp. JEL 0842]
MNADIAASQASNDMYGSHNTDQISNGGDIMARLKRFQETAALSKLGKPIGNTPAQKHTPYTMSQQQQSNNNNNKQPIAAGESSDAPVEEPDLGAMNQKMEELLTSLAAKTRDIMGLIMRTKSFCDSIAKKVQSRQDSLERRGKVLEDRKKRTRDQYHVFVAGGTAAE